jgi:nicotinamide-nucleotide amidase
MIAEIISIGDELLVGQVVNTNSTWIARQLNEIGIPVVQISAIADDATAIKTALDEAFSRADVILVTGGLGPTKDDITKHTLCEYFSTNLVFHQSSFENIERLFTLRGAKIIEVNRRQAEIPANCTPFLNQYGTAPGMWFKKDNKVLVSLPGVPFEMEAMMEKDVLPRLAGGINDRIVVHKTILTQGIGESALAELIEAWEVNLPGNMKLAYLPQPGIVRLRLTAYGESKEKTLQEVEQQVSSLRKLIPDLIFGYGNDTLEEVTGRLLKEKNLTLSTAESCTGGYLSHLVTSVPGSSDYYTGSVIAYSNRIKEEMLGVSGKTLEEFGAVSEQVVREMAEGARKRFDTDFAVSISGIAGPDGGTVEKPVGTVWIAVASKNRTVARKFSFGEHRGRNIRRAALAGLNMLRVEVISGH